MADRILLNATKGKPKSLSLCNKELKNVPSLIGKITSLKAVDLKNNVLTDLPEEFSFLKQVTISAVNIFVAAFYRKDKSLLKVGLISHRSNFRVHFQKYSCFLILLFIS